MKLVAEYLENAHHFERLADAEKNPDLKQRLQEQARAYHKLAKLRATNLGVPVKDVPPQSK